MFQYNTIEEALEALRAGKLILVSDDADRENEGDLICTAELYKAIRDSYQEAVESF